MDAYACMRAMIGDAAKEGYGEYRTHLLLQDQVAGIYWWNNNAIMRFNEKLKDALDPAGILAPGRSRIFGKSLHSNTLAWKKSLHPQNQVDGLGKLDEPQHKDPRFFFALMESRCFSGALRHCE